MLINDKSRLKSLDGLRGIAILMILNYHLFNVGFLYPIFQQGWAGVDLFFVLSGFLITGILLDTKGQKGWYKSFMLRRALRILPLYYSVLIVFAFVAPLSNATNWFSTYQWYFWTFTSNIIMLTGIWLKPLGHLWSLATEVQFYLIWPLFVFLLRPKWLIIISVLLLSVPVICRAIYNDQGVVYGLPLARMDGLLIGSILAAVIRIYKEQLFKYIDAIFIASIVLLIAYFIFNHSYLNALHEPFAITVTTIFFGALLVMALKSEAIAKAFSNKLLLFFGKYSYGMYVFNSIIYHYFNWAGVDRLSPNMRLLCYTGAFFLTVIISYASYHILEVRFLRLKQNTPVLYKHPAV